MDSPNMENEQAQNCIELRINTEQGSSSQFQEPKWMKILRKIMQENTKLNEIGLKS